MKYKYVVICVLFAFFMAAGFIQGFGLEQQFIFSQPSKQSPNTEIDNNINTLTFNSFRTRMATWSAIKDSIGAANKNPTPTPIPGNSLVLINGLIIDGTGAQPVSNGVVIVHGDRIIVVGKTDSVPIPDNAKIIDVAGLTIMPGIINAHVHSTYDAETRRHFLVDGVTSVCDLGTSLRVMPNFDKELTRQNQVAARGFKAGPMITAPGGYPSMFYGFSWHYEVATPDEATAAVETLADRGADIIKVALEPGHPQDPWPVLNLEQVQAVVTAAHSRGLLVRAHVRQARMLDVALDADVDAVEHIPLPFCLEAELKQMIEDNSLNLASLPEYEAQLKRMADQGVTLVPTLDSNNCVINRLPRLQPDERQIAKKFLLEAVRYFRECGGVVALGNDYGHPDIQRGMPLKEMKLLLEAGLTPMQVIEAATRHAAAVSGHGDELGTLQPGKLADIIVVDGNPLANLDAMNRVLMVIKDGEIAYVSESMTRTDYRY